MSSITASIPFPRATAERSAVNPWIIAITVTLATFMELLDTAIANVSLPHIAGGLAVSYDESTWVLTSYLVSNAVVLPLSAWLSRVFGRKRYYMLCVVLFTLSSLLCGLAPSLGLLIFFRVLQGVGGGGLAPVEQAILVDTFPKRMLLPLLCQTWGYIAFGKNQIATECFVSNLEGQRILGTAIPRLRPEPQSVPQILQ